MRAGLVFKKINITTFVVMAFLMGSNNVLAQLDDPTRPPGYRLVLPGGKKAATKTYYSLSSVRISKMRRSAVVNDRSVETGDMVNGAKVVAIYPSSVKLSKKGKTFTVRLISQVIKKTRIR
jgi:MSHA biogenesis protein MshK